MKKLYFLVLSIALLAVSCGGGGGGSSSSGGGSSSGSAPVLNSVAFSPSTAAHSAIVNISALVNFTDADGNLNGGVIKYTYEGNTYSVALGASFAGHTSGSINVSLISASLSATVGNVPVPVWLVDATGNNSNTVTVVLTQT